MSGLPVVTLGAYWALVDQSTGAPTSAPETLLRQIALQGPVSQVLNQMSSKVRSDLYSTQRTDMPAPFADASASTPKIAGRVCLLCGASGATGEARRKTYADGEDSSVTIISTTSLGRPILDLRNVFRGSK